MTPKDVENDTSALVSSLLEAKLAVDSNPVSLQRRGNFQHITWPSALGAPPVEPDDFATVAEYRTLVRSRYYTCMLVDGSLLQIGYAFKRNDLVKHRLCFYPAPVAIDPSEFEPEIDLGDLVDLYLEEELTAFRQLTAVPPLPGSSAATRLRMRSPIRFDYDLEAQDEDHPATHLHISHENCRWPVSAPLSVGHFARFVFRHFFPEYWISHAFLRDSVLRPCDRSITPTEELELFIDSRVVV